MYNEEQFNIKEQIVNEYAEDLAKLEKYLPWLERKASQEQQKYYKGDSEFTVMPVPIYDSTLLAFIKEAKNSKFMDRNYRYAYRRYHMQTPEDEIKAMERAKITDMQLFRGVLSKYVLQGQTKGLVWTEGLTNDIYSVWIRRLNKIFYDHSTYASRLIRDEIQNESQDDSQE